MKTETFANMLSDIDEAYVKAAEERVPRAKAHIKAGSILRIAAAAIFVVAILATTVAGATGMLGPFIERAGSSVTLHYGNHPSADDNDLPVVSLVPGETPRVTGVKEPVEAAKDPVEAWKEPVTVPADAVFAPVRNPDGLGSACRDGEMFYGYKSAFENADAVCLVTIENWLSECFICSFFEASVNKVYKGELPDKIVIRQEANSNFSMYNTPLFTYGNKLLVFLTVWDRWDEGVQQHDNAYALMVYGTGYLIYAQDNSGANYLIDLIGDISYKTKEAREADLTDHYSPELIGELIEYVGRQDSELAKTIELFTHDTDRISYEKEGRPMNVIRFDDMDDLLNELSGGEA
ncbi:MAG: hypothetical protein K6G90_09130 [Clostridia bacterium]|nr:hypothetical protein [Clostridia bacterium]